MATAQQQRDRKTRDADSALRLLVRLLARTAAREAVCPPTAPEGTAASMVKSKERSHD